MSNASQREYIALLRKHYQNSTRYIRSLILFELTRNLGIHRKHAIRLMNAACNPRKSLGRKSIYTEAGKEALKKFWLASRQMCSKKMKESMEDWLPMFDCAEEIKSELRRMSAATMDRILKSAKASDRRKKNTGTVPCRRLKNIIPVKPLDWNVKELGHVEADTVAHCGESMSGVFGWTLTMTDVLSGWTENRAMWGKSGMGVINSLDDIQLLIPFSLKSFSCDNGNEFLNHQLKHYLKIPLLRGRPYKSNDQCHVEQKNFTHVRDLFGYDRIETKEAIELMSDLYRNEWSQLNNFFTPQFKLLRKTRVGSQYKREYLAPKTPYKRILESKEVAEETKAQLSQIFCSLNPFDLQKKIEVKLHRIYKLMKEDMINRKQIA